MTELDPTFRPQIDLGTNSDLTHVKLPPFIEINGIEYSEEAAIRHGLVEQWDQARMSEMTLEEYTGRPYGE